MIRYTAPNPYQKKSRFSAFVSSFFSSGSSLSESTGKLILPAQMRAPKQLSQFHKNVMAYDGLHVETGEVVTYDDAVLDTIEITPLADENHQDETHKFHIIKFNGNGGMFEDLALDYATEAKRLDATVIAFNYRGVGGSNSTNPKIFQDLITDGIAQVQRLIAKGINSEKIMVDGISLGGVVATMVASHFHKAGLPIYLWNDRSLSKISKAAAGFVTPELSGIFGDPIASSLESSSWSVLKPAGWEADAAKAYNEIPEKYKAYMFVAKKSERSKGDGVIAPRAALHEGVKAFEKKGQFRTANKVLSYSLFGGHNDARVDLISADNPEINGQMIFDSAVRRNRR